MVALKVLKPAAAKEERRLLRFYQGARLCMQLAHPGVIQTFEVGCHQGQHFVVMEYVDGGNLARLVMRRGQLSERQALETVVAIASALEHIHQHGLLHRDVNPTNILLGADGRIVVADLGLSKDLECDLRLTVDGHGLGTPDYIAPEQFRDTKELGRAADVYGLGATLYVMLTGKLPFPGDTLAEKWVAKMKNAYRPVEQFCPTIQRSTAALIQRAMCPDPAGRPATAEEFAAAAKACLADLEASAVAASPATPSAHRWHVIMRARDGRIECRSGTEQQIMQLVGQNMLGPDTLASPGGGKQFERLSRQAAFKGLFSSPPRRRTDCPRPRPAQRWPAARQPTAVSNGAAEACQQPSSWQSNPQSGSLVATISVPRLPRRNGVLRQAAPRYVAAALAVVVGTLVIARLITVFS
jgi:serine/threonine protein kinase